MHSMIFASWEIYVSQQFDIDSPYYYVVQRFSIIPSSRTNLGLQYILLPILTALFCSSGNAVMKRGNLECIRNELVVHHCVCSQNLFDRWWNSKNNGLFYCFCATKRRRVAKPREKKKDPVDISSHILHDMH